MAAKKRKPARVGDLTARHLDKMSKRLDTIDGRVAKLAGDQSELVGVVKALDGRVAKLAEDQSELVGVVKAFKLDVQLNFRELTDKLVTAIAAAVATSVAQELKADRARMDALEARLAKLEDKLAS
jgi:polyhydroxyalkanoate synthesis regulator phasin